MLWRRGGRELQEAVTTLTLAAVSMSNSTQAEPLNEFEVFSCRSFTLFNLRKMPHGAGLCAVPRALAEVQHDGLTEPEKHTPAAETCASS